MSANEQRLSALERYDIVERSRGMESWKEIQHAPKDGEWVRYEDVKGELAFIDGYLLEHRHMLESLGAHAKVIGAVQFLRDRINKL